VHEVPVYDQKVGVWYVVNGWRIIGPVFFIWHSELGALCEQYFATFLSKPHVKREATCSL
jgi:hypothetical protein